MKGNHLKAKLAAGDPALGIWCCLGSEVSLEVAGGLGFDWALIDCEHGLAGYEDALRLLRACSGHAMTPIVRVPSAGDSAVFKRVLDMGAEGVLVPLIRSAAEVEQVVAECRYPPAGRRGIASHRAHGYGTDFMDYFQRSGHEVMVLVQIETAEAVEQVQAITEVEGLDGVLVGPSDLSAALGTPFDTKSDTFIRAIDRVLAACQRAGKPAGIYCRTPEDAKAWIERGFSFVNLCNDQSLLVRGIQGALTAMGG